MSYNLERNIEVNNWLIKVRWFYLAGIILMALLTKTFGKYELPMIYLVFFFLGGLAFNLFNILILFISRRLASKYLSKILSFWQVVSELLLFAVVFYFSGGLESLGALLFFLPIMSAGFFFGSVGAIVTASLSGLIISLIVYFEYTPFLDHVFMFSNEYDVIAYEDFSVALSYVIPYFIFYVIVGAYSGHISSLLIRRENMLDEKTMKLDQESKYRKNEWQQLDKTAKLLVKRDKELLHANREMDKKVKELQNSEAAMMKAFSDLKTGKKLLEAEKNKTSSIIENIVDPIIVLNNENKIELLNHSAQVVFSFHDDYSEIEISEDESYSMNNFKTVIGTSFKVSKIKEENGGNATEELLLNIAGQDVTYRVDTAKVIDKNNEHLGTMKVFHNMTREKMLDRLKSEFISIAAHQLRTPLSAIKWVIKMVLDGDAGALNEDQEALLKKGYKSNERIITLVNDMLNVSRIEEGRFGYSFKQDDLGSVLDMIVDGLQELIDKKAIKFNIKKSNDFPLLNIDAKKMTLVVQNLIENAIKYTPEHGKINIEMKKDGDFVKLSVQDNGIGIPKADQVKLFSKFYRAENALRLQTEGSGLGLFIVKNIVKTHGGDISFESEEGVGTKFIVTLPIDFRPSEDLGSDKEKKLK